MLKVNVTSIRAYSKDLRKYIASYETTSMSLLQEIRNADTEWHDDNSEMFFALSDTQRREIAKLTASLEDVCNRYDSIADSTVAVDASIERVFCNQGFKGVIKNKYDSAISKISYLINRIDNCSTYFCTWSEKSAINNARSSLNKSLDKIQKSYNRVEKLFEKLDSLEKYITDTLKGINIDPIASLDVGQFLR